MKRVNCSDRLKKNIFSIKSVSDIVMNMNISLPNYLDIYLPTCQRNFQVPTERGRVGLLIRSINIEAEIPRGLKQPQRNLASSGRTTFGHNPISRVRLIEQSQAWYGHVGRARSFCFSSRLKCGTMSNDTNRAIEKWEHFNLWTFLLT